jgi:two-component system, chemotaxis family, chemotaxis protein CheY
MRSLVVEDSPASRALLKRLLSVYGECAGAEDGISGLEAFKQGLSGAGQQYDLLCIDLELPGLDGVELLSRIREMERERKLKPTKVLIITGTADETNVRRVSELGADGYVLKPVDPQKLSKLLQETGISSKTEAPIGQDSTRRLEELCGSDTIPVSKLTHLIRLMTRSIERQTSTLANSKAAPGVDDHNRDA